MRFVAANRVIDPAQGLENVIDDDDGRDYDARQRSDAVGAMDGQSWTNGLFYI